ncbi:hypothetical protein BC833DRAFT_598743 [Globomyces pollinis-pini]|nr:hypothetical protein BC833DRAFT_598743 [Globomyces pollinis-pini]
MIIFNLIFIIWGVTCYIPNAGPELKSLCQPNTECSIDPQNLFGRWFEIATTSQTAYNSYRCFRYSLRLPKSGVYTSGTRFKVKMSYMDLNSTEFVRKVSVGQILDFPMLRLPTKRSSNDTFNIFTIKNIWVDQDGNYHRMLLMNSINDVEYLYIFARTRSITFVEMAISKNSASILGFPPYKHVWNIADCEDY